MLKTKEAIYKSHFIKFMNFIHGTDEYDLDHEFSDVVLGEIVPNDIVRFFKFKAFNIQDGRDKCEATDCATGCHESTLDMYKKVLLFLCPTASLRGTESTTMEIRQSR
jgi:hypothetical protein